MPDDVFERECDRLSEKVDGVQFERVRWSRDEGPKLDRLVELMHASVAGRPDIELVDEGSKGAIRRFVLKVHAFRIIAVSLGLGEGRVSVWGEPIERSQYRVEEGQRHSADYSEVDEAWMKGALSSVMAEVR